MEKTNCSKILINSALLQHVKDLDKYQQYIWIHNTWTQDRITILSAISNNMFDKNNLDTYFNYELRTINEWIIKNIVLQMYRMTEATLGVLLRIATGMLNKCTSIDKDEKIRLHDHLCVKLKREYYEMVNESLPF